MTERRRTIVFFPEGAFGPTNNCVGIGDVLRAARPPGGVHRGRVLRRDAGGAGIRGGADASGAAAGGTGGAGPVLEGLHPRHTPSYERPPSSSSGSFLAPTWQALIDGSMYVNARLEEI